jgi:two-component system, OmpR family, manganese sensing sensor histidine kinase
MEQEITMSRLRPYVSWMLPSRETNQQLFQMLSQYWQLLLSYLVTMIIILGTSAAALNEFFSRRLTQQLEKQLLILAQAATPSLGIVKTKNYQRLGQELPWRELFSTPEQGLEWFDAEGRHLARTGQIFPRSPLFQKPLSNQLKQGTPVFARYGQVKTVTIAVYIEDSALKSLQLQGYIRASESTEHINLVLRQLRFGLAIGALTALILIVLSSVYLTRQALTPMRQSFQRLKRFTADASHELRNPLTRISLATELMLSQEGPVHPSDSRELTMIANATDQMQYLIEDLLFLARTEVAPLASTNPEGLQISLDQLLQALIEQFELQARKKQITVQAQLLPDLSMRGDANQLTRLFSNLLENALKYTEGGGCITVSVEQLKRNAIVQVEDTGIGIPSEYQPFVFQRFLRSEQSLVQQQDGLGLGLAIAQAIAKQHGGEISVSSQVGIGSIFRVRLPLSS